MDVNSSVVVCGGGGFIGGHLVGDLVRKGFKHVRCVDIKPTSEWYQVHGQAENVVADLNLRDAAFKAVKGADYVFNLACNMGGMGFIENNKALCMLSVLTNTHMLMAARDKGVERFFYSSSACVYNGEKQTNPNVVALKEEDAKITAVGLDPKVVRKFMTDEGINNVDIVIELFESRQALAEPSTSQVGPFRLEGVTQDDLKSMWKDPVKWREEKAYEVINEVDVSRVA